ncbi:corrinoid protein [Methanolobus halotolerans]|uniref:Corrinoid protein n=1 Tax=Methanolobus halotolerans TaxID=2052935 RepID=A0A4E0QYI2_9EURY|nr:corrinoid protein [Methanolobus halotolerans]TGC08719.1 corrinoid protein [Methanolobus halotolerans]
MEENEIINGLTEAVVNGKKDQAAELSQKSLDEGVDPYIAVINGLAKGMEIMSEKYENKQAFMPHLLMASNAMYAGMDVLIPHIKTEGSGARKVLVIGAVEGDVHDIGKNLVKTMMSAVGFEAIDLGKDVPVEQFVEAAAQNKADVMSISTLMTSTMDNMQRVMDGLNSKGIRNNMKVIVGGAPITADFATEIGADATKTDAMEAARWAKEAVESLSPGRWD